MEYYSVIRKNEIMPFAATQMHLEIVTLSEVSQKETISYDITCVWNWLYDTDEQIYKTKADLDIENRLVLSEGWGWGM